MEQKLKCLRCGYEYTARMEAKDIAAERVCPRCQSNSVRRLSSEKK